MYFEDDTTLGDLTPGLGGSFGGSTVGTYVGSTGANTGGNIGAGLGGSVNVREMTLRVVINPADSWLSYIPGAIGVASIAYENYAVQNEIARDLTSRGWSVTSVTGGDMVAGGRSFDIRVTVNTEFNDSETVNGMRSDLSRVGTVRSVNIVNQTAAQYITPSMGNANVGSENRLIGGGSFLGNLGLGLGVSTPVVILGGAVLLVLLMRR